jgi:phage-related protein (TIGR01555 family)
MKRRTQPAKPVPEAKKLAISYDALARFASTEPEPVRRTIGPPVLAPGVVPASAKQDPSYMALDDAGCTSLYAYANLSFAGMGFPGYPYLSELTQRSEYRSPSETTATEMTRRWLKIVSQGDGDNSDKIEKIEAELKRHNVRDIFRVAAEQDGFFGRAQIYVSIKGVTDDSRKLPMVLAPETIKKGSLIGFKNIEALWTTPYAYNSNDPLAPDFYKPTSWFVMGKQTHASRLLTIISREVPDMLKPAYNFGGMSMSQLMEPYVQSWLRTRDSVSDLLHSFSISGLATDMTSTLSGGSGDDLFKRAQLFNQIRDNRGLMLLDKENEEFFQFNTPLSGLDKLQAQSQEHMAAPSHTPLVKLLGITPTGLNASTDGEITVYYDYIRAMQENIFTAPLTKILELIQLDQFGEIDPAIGFEYEPLTELDGEALSRVRKSDADAGVAYITAGVISPEEERIRLANDPGSGYTSLDAEDLPTPPADPDVKPESDPAMDAEFSEGDHPRAENGKFGNGGSGGNSSPTAPVTLKSKNPAPFIASFVNEHKTEAAMKAALKTKSSEHLKKALELMEQGGHSASRPMVERMLKDELKSREKAA